MWLLQGLRLPPDMPKSKVSRSAVLTPLKNVGHWVSSSQIIWLKITLFEAADQQKSDDFRVLVRDCLLESWVNLDVPAAVVGIGSSTPALQSGAP